MLTSCTMHMCRAASSSAVFRDESIDPQFKLMEKDRLSGYARKEHLDNRFFIIALDGEISMVDDSNRVPVPMSPVGAPGRGSAKKGQPEHALDLGARAHSQRRFLR